MVASALEVRERFAAAGARRRAPRPRGVQGRLRAVPGRPPGASLMAESRNSLGGAYALTDLRADPARPRGRAAGLPRGAADRRREPARAPGHAAPLAHPDLRRARVPGPEADATDAASPASCVFTSTLRRRPRSLPRRDLRAHRPRPTVVGPLRRLPGDARTARVQALDPRAPGRHQPVRLGQPERERAEVRESLALRERVVDFAVDGAGPRRRRRCRSASAPSGSVL